MHRETLRALIAARESKRPAVLVSALESGAQTILYADAPDEAGLAPEVRDACLAALAADRSRLLDGEDGLSLFAQVFNPPLRMVIVGAVHITQALAPMADLLGYDVTVVDPRRAFASDERFPGIRIETEWPDDLLRREEPDRRTAVVTLTHDPKIDDPALEASLSSDAFYIGSLGSRRTHAARLERLGAAGFDASVLERIHGPIGLDIGAGSPAEIAVAIVAEITEALRRTPVATAG